MPVRRFGPAMRSAWAIDPDITYLNHGTVGAPPRRVLEAQQAIRDEIERQPARFLLRDLAGPRVGRQARGVSRLRDAADRVAAFVGVRGQDLVFVDNVTAGVNAVLRSLDLHPGDEILLLDHAYGGIVRAAGHIAGERGAALRTVEMPWPPAPEAILDRIVAALGPRTRIAVIDHITAESALILPLADIAAACRDRGVPVLADGAHAPGAIPLSIEALGVDWYVGSLHKWAWAPRSSAFLWARPARQHGLHPPVVSWGLGEGFTAEFDWPGTRDPTAHLAAPAGIAYLRELGVRAVQDYNHGLAWQAGIALAERWNTGLAQTEGQIGTMVTVPVPPSLGATADDAADLRDALLFDERIEVQVHVHRGQLAVRVSAQVYNDEEDIARLAAAVARRA